MPGDATNLRYAAHLPLSGIGDEGQARIRDSHIALIGVGGLGCAAAQYLVSSGIGELSLCDFDSVAESNLSRQVIYKNTDVGPAIITVPAWR
jgi:molybdopterin/thiamine biosynthesis adenylyltransferase